MVDLRPQVFSRWDCCNSIGLEEVWRRQREWHLSDKKTRPPGQLLHRVQF